MAAFDLKPAPGILLVAPPMMPDPNFSRTVILLCEHNEDGSFGLILNRPLTLTLSDLIQELDEDASISFGGPVQQDTLHVLHRHSGRIKDSVSVLDTVYWGGDFENIKDLLLSEPTTPQDLRFFLGYAGWSAGQLAEEIDQGDWFLAHAHSTLVFVEDPHKLWRKVLIRMGGDYAMLANFPEDPMMN